MKKTVLDWKKYIDTSSRTISEGIVMLRNNNGVLPLRADADVAVFGRIQLHYYKSGTGSGGMVNVSHVVGITEALIDSGKVRVNSELLEAYKSWDAENPFDLGEGWGNEPWSQVEMPLSDELVKSVAKSSRTAIVIIGRTAGEEQDNRAEKGAYLLSDEEENMLSKVRKNFSEMIVLLNVGGLIDMSFVGKYSPDAVLYVWQGGMVGGTGTADVLTGKISPSGKLPDTIAYSVTDYPSHNSFGNKTRNFYSEDIYVGYRYFETFAKDRVMYPFGFGLSYTSFDISTSVSEASHEKVVLDVTVRNTGDFTGKEVVQIYCEAPWGELGKPSRTLCAFEKTKALAPSEEQRISITVKMSDVASYDDSGASGYKSCYVLEGGEYNFYAGTDVRTAEKAASVTFEETVAVKQLEQALAPVMPFERLKPACVAKAIARSIEKVPLYEFDEREKRLADLPHELEVTGDRGIKLYDIADGNNTLEEFTAQLSDYDLSCIIRGEGMGSPKVTAGTASAFGGVSDSLASYGIPCACCADGPAGIRLDCGTKAFSLPNGTLIASTFNKELVSELFEFLGLELAANKVDCLLGPGMNIHRYVLNGRNFEYFSEDPFLTGTMAAAELKGLHKSGAEGTIKHFCGNNQEIGRHTSDSVISERALREIYLRGFEIAVKDGHASSVMTSYGSVNGLWTAGSYDLTTTILRKEWGFNGFVMTDWWANINERGKEPDKSAFAAMARAQNDVYMVCSDAENSNDNTLASLENGTLTRGELQRNAMNILRFLMTTNAMKRLRGNQTEVEIINREESDDSLVGNDVVFYKLDKSATIDLSGVESVKGAFYAFALDVSRPGNFIVTITASSDSGELSQIPLTMFAMSTACATYTWNGTNGKPVSLSRKVLLMSRFTSIRLFFAQSGLKLTSITFEEV